MGVCDVGFFVVFVCNVYFAMSSVLSGGDRDVGLHIGKYNKGFDISKYTIDWTSPTEECHLGVGDLDTSKSDRILVNPVMLTKMMWLRGKRNTVAARVDMRVDGPVPGEKEEVHLGHFIIFDETYVSLPRFNLPHTPALEHSLHSLYRSISFRKESVGIVEIGFLAIEPKEVGIDDDGIEIFDRQCVKLDFAFYYDDTGKLVSDGHISATDYFCRAVDKYFKPSSIKYYKPVETKKSQEPEKHIEPEESKEPKNSKGPEESKEPEVLDKSKEKSKKGFWSNWFTQKAKKSKK